MFNLKLMPEDRLTIIERRLTALKRRVDGLATHEQLAQVSADVAELKGMVRQLLTTSGQHERGDE